MNRTAGTKSGRTKRALSTLAIFLGCVLLISSALQGTFTSPSYPTILGFERANPVYEMPVVIGTEQNQLGLPDSLRAVLPLASLDLANEAESGEPTGETGFRQTQPLAREDGGYNYEQYGYAAPENESALRAAGALVIYTLNSEDGAEAYRIHGTYGGENEGFYACDQGGDITGVVVDVPVIWYGAYDAETPDTYTFTARITGYDYAGEIPTAVVMVMSEEQEGQIALSGASRAEMSTRAIDYTLADLAIAGRNDLIKNVDGLHWRVIKKQELNGVNYYLLVTSTTHHHHQGTTSRFSSTSTNYNGSELQKRMTDHYNSYPTIRAIAVVPDLGVLSSEGAISQPTAVMAMDTTQKTDIMFALSLQDYINWNNGIKTPLYAPLNDNNYGQRSWSRTPRTGDELWAMWNVPSSYSGVDGGVKYNSYTQIGEIPAVWVNGDAVWRKINLHYVDTDGKTIAKSEIEPVFVGNTLTLENAHKKPINGYAYKEYKKGSLTNPSEGSGFKNPTLNKAEVIANTDIYLIYEKTASDVTVTVHYINKDNGGAIGTPTYKTYSVPVGGTFLLPLQEIPNITGFEYKNEWKVGLSGAVKTDAYVIVDLITSNTDVYLLYEKPKAPASDVKNAYVNGAGTAQNGTFSHPVPVALGDKIKYTITTVNKKQPGVSDAKYDILFVLDWSQSMDIGWMYGSGPDERSARDYELDVMLDMFDMIADVYPESRVAVMAMNSTGMHDDLARTYLQYDTVFLTPSEYKNGGRAAMAATFTEPWKNATEDPATFLNAAIYKLKGMNNIPMGGNAGGAKYILPRTAPDGENLDDRIPVIVLISDFQIPRNQKVGGLSGTNYWQDAMRNRATTFGTSYPDGIMLAVRFDHLGNHTGLNEEYSTSEFDGYLTANVSPATAAFPPAGKPHWGFTKVDMGTPYQNALGAIKDKFIALAPPPEGTIITDKVPEGLEVDVGSISHKGVYDPGTRVITWDLSLENEGEITVAFTATVKQQNQTFANTATIEYETKATTNTTYHKSQNQNMDVTITKTVKGKYANLMNPFDFTV